MSHSYNKALRFLACHPMTQGIPRSTEFQRLAQLLALEFELSPFGRIFWRIGWGGQLQIKAESGVRIK